MSHIESINFVKISLSYTRAKLGPEYGIQIATTIRDLSDKLKDQEKSLHYKDLLKLEPFKIVEKINDDLKTIS